MRILAISQHCPISIPPEKENVWFSEVFWGFRTGAIAWNELATIFTYSVEMFCYLNSFLRRGLWLKGSTNIGFFKYRFKENIQLHVTSQPFSNRFMSKSAPGNYSSFNWKSCIMAYIFGSIYCQAFNRIAVMKISGDILKNCVIERIYSLKIWNSITDIFRGIFLVFRTVMFKITSEFCI